MLKKLFIILTLFLFSFSTNIKSKERSIMIMKLKTGEVKIELFDEIAPNHVKRIKALADAGKYDGVAFHRVIDGFMAQTGDVKYGNTKLDFNAQMVGTGGSEFPDLKAEFNNIPHQRGVLSMARSQSPDSANSQFFICFDTHAHLEREILSVKQLEWMSFNLEFLIHLVDIKSQKLITLVSYLQI